MEERGEELVDIWMDDPCFEKKLAISRYVANAYVEVHTARETISRYIIGAKRHRQSRGF